MAQRLRTLVVLPEDPIMVAYKSNSSSRGYDALFWSLVGTRHTEYIDIHAVREQDFLKLFDLRDFQVKWYEKNRLY